MSTELTAHLRSVLDAARRFSHKERDNPGNVIPAEHVAGLLFAVRTLDEALAAAPNKPTGFILTRTWAEVPAGWFVQGPGGQWFEVLATRAEDGKQYVSLDVNGKVGEWPRDPTATVKVKRGTLTAEVDKALDTLTGAFGPMKVLEETPPW